MRLKKYEILGFKVKCSDFWADFYTWTNPAGSRKSRKFFSGLNPAGFEVRDLRDLLDFVVLIILEQCALGKNNVKLNSKNILFTTFFAKFL